MSETKSLHCALLALLSLGTSSLHAQFTEPTPAELKMTSIPQVPGAPAVYLFREETTEDALHMFSVYVRLKVLSEAGKEYANVEIPFLKDQAGYTVDNIQGRTIHSDGSVTPLTAKPYDKLVDKIGGYKYMAKVFSMPSVDVGSIVEYRYKLHMDDQYFRSPRWYIQSKVFTVKAHYRWKPTNETIIVGNQHGQLSSSIAWMPILPKDADFKQITLPGAGQNGPQQQFDLNVTNIPPIPDEEFMPPIDSFSYRMIFYYSAATSIDDFWKTEAKYWTKEHDRFIGPGSGVRGAVSKLVGPSDTQEQKLKKLYDAVMELENTDFTRQRSTAEEKAAGLRDIKNADDVLARKRGSSDQLANLFVAMARAAGMKAYAMSVVNRDRSVFVRGFMDSSQLDDDIAIVEVDGKERYFDPGQRYCEFGHLAWKHTLASGMRQTDKGALIADTPFETYKAANTKRVANLTMDEHGEIKGKMDLTFTGDPALVWRHEALRGDDTSVHKDLKDMLEGMLPGGLEVKVTGVEHMAEYSQPLQVHYEVSGMAGNSTGKRLLMPADIFRTNAKPTFSQTKREVPVYFHFADQVQDAVRITFPPTIGVESIPASDKFMFKTQAAYNISTESTPTSFTVRRNLTVGDVLFLKVDYPELREFYGKFETKDQEPVVLTHKDAGSAVSAKPAS
jgi:hypothetical protein